MQAREALSPRRQIAEILSEHYRELASIRDTPQPRVSIARVVSQLADGGACDGAEARVLEAAALAENEAFNAQRVRLPWSALTPRRDLTAETGGMLIGDATRPAVEALRGWSVALRAGATMLPNLHENLSIPREDAELSGSWLAIDGTSAATPSAPTLDSVYMVPHTFAAVVRFSRQFLRQSPEAETFIRRAILRAAGRALDRAILQGAGHSGEPAGLVNVAAVPTVAGGSLDNADILAMREAVTTAGADDAAAIWIGDGNLRELLSAREAVSTSGRMIWQDDRIDNRAAFATPDAPAATLFHGDFSKLAIALWGSGPELMVDPYSNFKSGLIDARVLLTVDCAPLQAGAFVIATDVS